MTEVSKRKTIRAVLDVLHSNRMGQPPQTTPRAKRKRGVTFDSPTVHHFDKESPAKRRIIGGDQTNGECSENLQNDQLAIELQEHGLSLHGTRGQRLKRLQTYIHAELQQDLQQRGMLSKEQGSNMDYRELRRKMELFQQLERKARVVMIYGSEGLPGRMDMTRLRKELKTRRLSDNGDRDELESRLEHALLKDDCPHVLLAEDGYAFGRVEVDLEEFLAGQPDEELRRRLRDDHGIDDIPRKKDMKIHLLREIYDQQLEAQMEEALKVVLRDALKKRKLPVSEDKAGMFMQLEEQISRTELNGATLWAFELPDECNKISSKLKSHKNRRQSSCRISQSPVRLAGNVLGVLS